jgi:hypothetical protein
VPLSSPAQAILDVVLSGRPFIIACLMPAGDIAQNIGELRNLDIGSTLGRQRG